MLHPLPYFAWSSGLVLAIALLGVLSPLLASAAGSVTLGWNPSTSSDVAGYNLYYGIISHIYLNEISVGDTNVVTVSNLTEGISYYFAVTAYDTTGVESLFSNEVSYDVPLNPLDTPPVLGLVRSNGGINLQVSGVTGYPYAVEESTNLTDWIPVATNFPPFTFTITNTGQLKQKFFRAVYLPQ